MRKHGGTPFRRDTFVTMAAIGPSGVARGRFVQGRQSGRAGGKPPSLFMCGASSCTVTGATPRGTMGCSSGPERTYLPTQLPEDPYHIKVGPLHFTEGRDSQLRAREPGFREKHVKSTRTTQPSTPFGTTTMLSRTTTLSRRSLPSLRTPRRLAEWSSRRAGEAIGCPTTPGNPCLPFCRGSIPPPWSTCAGTRPSSSPLSPKLSPTRFRQWLTHPRRELSLRIG